MLTLGTGPNHFGDPVLVQMQILGGQDRFKSCMNNYRKLIDKIRKQMSVFVKSLQSKLPIQYSQHNTQDSLTHTWQNV